MRLVIRSDRFTPTYTKPMLREPDGSARELNRLDIKNRTPLPADAEDQLIARLRGLLPRVHGVIIADQVQEADCGVITERVRDELAALAQAYPTWPSWPTPASASACSSDVHPQAERARGGASVDPAGLARRRDPTGRSTES